MQKDKHAVRLEASARANIAYPPIGMTPDVGLFVIQSNRNVGFTDGYEAGYAQALQDVDLTFVNTNLAERLTDG